MIKYLLITLIVQDGENRHDHRILHVTKGQNVQFVAQWYAAHFYGSEAERNQDWWEFQAGSIAVEMYSVVELSEFEYTLLKRIFDNEPKPKDYFEIVRAGNYPNMDREEIQVHCGENGNLFIFKTDEGFIVDVYNQNDNVDTLAIWEEDLETPEEETKGELGQKHLEPTKAEVKAYLKEWGQKQGEITANLGYPASHSESDELLMEDYFFLEGKKQWYPKTSRMYSEREQEIADFIRNNQSQY